MEIANQTFESAHEARQFVRHLLAKYAFGTEVTDPQDLVFLRALVLRHAKHRAAFQRIERIIVVRNRRQKATELQLFHLDGKQVQIPWTECLLDEVSGASA